jgi:hypothetical protein
MDSYLMFLNCPAYMDNNGAARCGLPAEVHCRYTMNSTDGRWKAPRSAARAATTSTGPSTASPCRSSRPRPPYQPACRRRPVKALNRAPDRKTIAINADGAP